MAKFITKGLIISLNNGIMEDFVIFMPTRGRTDIKLQATLNVLPVDLKQYLIIVCHPGEESWFKDNYGNVKEILPMEASHIGEVRQNCIDLANSDYIIFIDDSLNFNVRAESDKGTETVYPLKVMTEKHFYPETIASHLIDMFLWIVEKLYESKFGLVGVSRRSSNNFVEEDFKLNDRICSFWGINRKLFNSLPNSPKFSDMQLKEDFYISLHFLTNGIPTISTYKYAYGRVGGANTKGGCSIYRNIENSNKSAHDLHRHFPDFVKIREKGVKSWNGEFEQVALDVTVSSKKAYEYGIKKINNEKNNKG